jgi:hypothetical protein
MQQFAAFLVTAIVALIAYVLWMKNREYQRAEFIRTYNWPPQLLDKLNGKYPHFTRKETSLVSKGLRQFFMAYLKGGLKPVSMPSEVVDELWHEFILYTRSYKEFCDRAFGDFLHHSPAVTLSPERRASNEGLRRVWWQCCREENIDAKNPTRLPLLFALDSKLNIPNGYRYVADCSGIRRDTGSSGAPNCAGDFGSSSVDGSTDGFGESGGGDGGGGGDSGGDGGGGCGGGGGD